MTFVERPLARLLPVATMLCLALCVAVTARAAEGDVLFQQQLHPYPVQPIIPLNVDGKAYPFMLDTGTYGPIFDFSIRKILGPVAQKGMLSSFGSQTETDFYNAPRMNIGRLTLAEWMAATQDCSVHRKVSGLDVRGIMGIKPLDSYSIWFDFDHETLKIEAQAPPPEDMTALDFVYMGSKQIPRVQVELEGETVQFIVDSGFNGSMGLQHEVFAKLVANGSIRQMENAGSERLVGGGAEKVASGRFKSGTLFGLDLASSEVHDSGSVSNIGMAFLLNFNFVFDLAGKKFYYVRRHVPPTLDPQQMIGAVILFPEGRNVIYRINRGPSAAREAGLKEGDHIVRMGSLTDNLMNAAAIYDLCLHHYSEIMEVEVARPGVEKTFITHLQMPRQHSAFPAGQSH